MQKHTKYLKFPFRFNKEKLIQDLSLILDRNWIAHFNKSGYDGDWKVISLYAHNGDESNIYALSTANSILSETAILKECHYFKEVIDFFECPILSARILRLGVGAEIKPHRDHKLGYEDGNFRLHIPIVTNPDVQFILDGIQLTMLPGECWYTNVNYVHSVINSGESDRVHLVIDGERNEWSDQLFFSLAPKESFQAIPEESDSPEKIKQIIEQLKRSNEPIAEQLINELLLKLTELKETQ
ncbi:MULTISPECIES: aspartyl/asparaginyl beta-hydroxylase domain-containing protein [Mesonia]|uniref:L-proline cis-4-hydroxylase n=1 Tax=Mesonia oceanica TaxID=2687242 RepID=A0AC61YDL9_9FLAO|nr:MULTISPECIES: aspartyl/asparaginyl beta-hydroxylase domain-containing protein [Mesonia]MAN28730.1 aspartyl beta-hydroxylase [Mesonia sp.]MAQ39720.1 aspartyl beta-hydroxylase [Mesonia sp.]VVV02203.1 L-proline cis-4-hydroxylase [Mesonia oceanica]|tara:strand:- start:2171 stop:2893 length:723 start_codon:yes stop_codon:yes gene_type:complete